MTVYCIDTSALIGAWQERYPIANFPPFWQRMEALIDQKRLVAPDEVLHEIGEKSDELRGWLKDRDSMFVSLSEQIQIEAAQILTKFPRLVAERKFRTSADPFVIALAKLEGFQLVTEERPTGSANRPNIPDVCQSYGMTSCMNLLQMIQAENWVIG